MTEMASMGRRVRHVREKLGLNGVGFAKMIGVSSSFLSQVETGKK